MLIAAIVFTCLAIAGGLEMLITGFSFKSIMTMINEMLDFALEQSNADQDSAQQIEMAKSLLSSIGTVLQVFCIIIGILSLAVSIITLIVEAKKKTKYFTCMGVLSIVFCNLIGGILLLCSKKTVEDELNNTSFNSINNNNNNNNQGPSVLS